VENGVRVRVGREPYGGVVVREAGMRTAELLEHEDNYLYAVAVALQVAATLSDRRPRSDKGIG
jgi:hypothetical protein